MILRKVAKEDEIATADLSPKAINRRKSHFYSLDLTFLEDDFKEFLAWVERYLNPERPCDVNVLVARAYALVDCVMDEVGKASVCRKGCGYCCRVPVDVSTIEAAYIDNVYRVGMLDTPKARLTKEEKHRCCPFLDPATFTCQIHHARPLNCRSFLAIDDWRKCRDPETKHLIFTTHQSALLRKVQEVLMFASRHAPYPIKTGDLRQFFP